MKKTAAIILSFISILILLFSCNNDEQPREIYVSPEGNDEQAGTLGSPLKTLNEASTRAKTGTIVHVREGIYWEGLVVRHSGAKSKPVVFTAYEDEEVVLSGADFESREGDTALITIEDQNYVEISGFTLQDLSTELEDETVTGIRVSGSSSHIVLEENKVRRISTQSAEGNAHGMAVYGTERMTDITISGNIIEDLKLGSSEALVLNGNIDGFTITNNIVRRCDNIGIDLIGHEGVSQAMDYVRNGIVSGNEVFESSSYGNPAYGNEYSAAGIYVDGGKDIRIENNEVHHNDIGIEASSEHKGRFAERIEIVDNAIYENVYTGIAIGGYDEHRGGTKASLISKNRLEGNDAKGLGGGQMLIQYAATNNVVGENVLVAEPSDIFIANYMETGGNNKFHKNIFCGGSEDGIWIWQDEEFTSFANFKEALGD